MMGKVDILLVKSKFSFEKIEKFDFERLKLVSKIMKLVFEMMVLVFKMMKLVLKMPKLVKPAFHLQGLGWLSHKKKACKGS